MRFHGFIAPRASRRRTSSLVVVLVLSPLCLAQQPASQEATPAPAAAKSDEPPPGLRPQLTLSRDEWDFGAVWYGEPCESEIELKNTGAAPLQIIEVKTSCGCTAAQPSKKTLAPGETDSVRISYNTSKGIKQVSQTVTIRTNDPQNPDQIIRVRGEVKNVYDAQPDERVAFGQLTPGSIRSQTIALKNNLDEDVVLKLRPMGPAAPFHVELEEVQRGREYNLHVATKNPMNPGSASLAAYLDTGHEKFKTMKIPISAYVMDRVGVMPPQVLVNMSEKKPGRRMLRVNYLPDHPLNVKSVTCDTPGVQVTLMPQRGDPSEYSAFAYQMISVVVPPHADMPDEDGQIIIETDDPDPQFQKLLVPVKKQQLPRAISARRVENAGAAGDPPIRQATVAPGGHGKANGPDDDETHGPDKEPG